MKGWPYGAYFSSDVSQLMHIKRLYGSSANFSNKFFFSKKQLLYEIFKVKTTNKIRKRNTNPILIWVSKFQDGSCTHKNPPKKMNAHFLQRFFPPVKFNESWKQYCQPKRLLIWCEWQGDCKKFGEFVKPWVTTLISLTVWNK